jgi:Mlc titration factor MtfA (ptsG expression regulator)
VENVTTWLQENGVQTFELHPQIRDFFTKDFSKDPTNAENQKKMRDFAMSAIVDGMSHALKDGIRPPKIITFDANAEEGDQGSNAEYIPADDRLSVYFNGESWGQFFMGQGADNANWFAGKEAADIIKHEMAHKGHLDNLLSDPGLRGELVDLFDWSYVMDPANGFALDRVADAWVWSPDVVSEYAGRNPMEFVAEVYTGIAAGKTYDDNTLYVYKQLYGPYTKSVAKAEGAKWTLKSAGKPEPAVPAGHGAISVPGLFQIDLEQKTAQQLVKDDGTAVEPYVPGKIQKRKPYLDNASMINHLKEMGVELQGTGDPREFNMMLPILDGMYATDRQGHPTPKVIRVNTEPFDRKAPAKPWLDYSKQTGELVINLNAVMGFPMMQEDEKLDTVYQELGKAAWHLGGGAAAAGGDFYKVGDKQFVKDELLFSGDPDSFVGTVYSWKMMQKTLTLDDADIKRLENIYEDMNGPSVNTKILKTINAAPPMTAKTLPDLPTARLTAAVAEQWLKDAGVTDIDIASGVTTFQQEYEDARFTRAKDPTTLPGTEMATHVFLTNVLKGLKAAGEDGIPIPASIKIMPYPPGEPNTDVLADANRNNNEMRVFTKDPLFWVDPEIHANMERSGWHTDGSIPGVILHEMGHFGTFENKRQTNTIYNTWGDYGIPRPADPDAFQQLQKSVSQYGESSPLEWVAEMYAGVMAGKPFKPEQFDYYEQWQGPVTPAVQAARKAAEHFEEQRKARAKARVMSPEEQAAYDAAHAGKGVYGIGTPRLQMQTPPVPVRPDNAAVTNWLQDVGVKSIKLDGLDDFEETRRNKGSSDPELERQALGEALLRGFAQGLQGSDQAHAPANVILSKEDERFTIGYGRDTYAMVRSNSVGASPEKLYIDVTHKPQFWQDDTMAQEMEKEGWWTSNSRSGIVVHELGHVVHLNNIKTQGVVQPGKKGVDTVPAHYWDSFDQVLPPEEAQQYKATLAANPEIKNVVSQYGARNPVEWVAEVYAGVVGAGKNYPPEVMDFYRLLKGPEISPTYVYTPAKGAR